MLVPLQLNIGGTGNLGNGVIDDGNTKIYLRGGKKHRLNGPSEIKRDGYEAWFRDGNRHRENGPAVTYPDGRVEFWIDGKKVQNNNISMA